MTNGSSKIFFSSFQYHLKQELKNVFKVKLSFSFFKFLKHHSTNRCLFKVFLISFTEWDAVVEPLEKLLLAFVLWFVFFYYLATFRTALDFERL